MNPHTLAMREKSPATTADLYVYSHLLIPRVYTLLSWAAHLLTVTTFPCRLAAHLLMVTTLSCRVAAHLLMGTTLIVWLLTC